MAGYFFDIHDGGSTQDDTGIECSDHEAPRKLAIRTLPDMARDRIPKHGDGHQSLAIVTDGDGGPIFSATLGWAGVWLDR